MCMCVLEEIKDRPPILDVSACVCVCVCVCEREREGVYAFIILYMCASNFTHFSPYRKAAVHHSCIYRCDAVMSVLLSHHGSCFCAGSVVCSSLS